MAKRKVSTKSLHERRGVTYQEMGAFLAVKGMLQEKVLTHARDPWVELKAGDHLINMEVTGKVKDCGSIGCIGGNMAIVMGRDPDVYVPAQRGCVLGDLFYPPDQYVYKRITAAHMLKAMNNWQRTGKPMWKKVLPKSTLE